MGGQKNTRQSNIILRYWVSAITVKTAAEAIILPFLPLYGLTLNASLVMIGLLVSVNSLFGIAQIFWAGFAERKQKLRFTALLTNYVASLLYFIFAFSNSIILLIIVRAIQSLIGSGFFPTSTALLTKRTRIRDWGFWNSSIQAANVGGTIIGVLMGGIILDNPSSKEGYVVLFILAGILGILSALLFHLSIPSQARLIRRKKWVMIEETEVTLNNALAVMKTDKNFVILCVATFVLVLGTNLSGPFYIIFNTQYYDLTVFESSILTAIGLVPQLIVSLLTYKFLDKVRKKELIIITGIILSSFPAIYIMPYILGYTKNLFVSFIVLWILNGASWGMTNTAFTMLVLDVIHPGRRALQLAINNSVSAISLFLAPIIGGIITGNMPFYYVFVISSLGRFAGIAIFKFVHEPIIGGTILRPIRRVFHLPIHMHSEKTEVVASVPTTKSYPEIDRNTKIVSASELPIHKGYERLREF